MSVAPTALDCATFAASVRSETESLDRRLTNYFNRCDPTAVQVQKALWHATEACDQEYQLIVERALKTAPPIKQILTSAAFRVALDKLPWDADRSKRRERAYKELLAWNRPRPAGLILPTTDVLSSLRSLGAYNRWLQGFSLSLFNYFEGNIVRMTKNAPRKLRVLEKKVAAAIDLLEDSDVRDAICFAKVGSRVDPLTQSLNALRQLHCGIENQSELLKAVTPTRRSDPILPERLLCVFFIRANLTIFGKPHLPAVKELMSLPFIKAPIESKTVDRLWQKEAVRRNLTASLWQPTGG